MEEVGDTRGWGLFFQIRGVEGLPLGEYDATDVSPLAIGCFATLTKPQ